MAEYFLCAKKLRQFFPYAICYMPPILIYIAVSGLPEHCSSFLFPPPPSPSSEDQYSKAKSSSAKYSPVQSITPQFSAVKPL